MIKDKYNKQNFTTSLKLEANILTLLFLISYKMYKSPGFALVSTMISVSIVILLASIAIPQLLRIKMTANESLARATLKTISTALENYAAANQQVYPSDISVLMLEEPPYLKRNYVADSPLQGYNYTCGSLDAGSYSCQAEPVDCNVSGSKRYTIATAGVFSEEDCG